MAEAKFKLGVDISQWVAGLTAGQKALQKFSNVTVKVSKDFSAFSKVINQNNAAFKRLDASITRTSSLLAKQNSALLGTRRTYTAFGKVVKQTAAISGRSAAGQARLAKALNQTSKAIVDNSAKAQIGNSVNQKFAKTTQVLTNRTNALGRAFQTARGFVMAYIGVFIGARLVEFADSVQRIENRLKLAREEGQSVEDIMGKVAKVARDSRQPLEATATAFFRISQASKSLGLNQNQVLKATQLFNQRLTIQGVTMHEARSALLQFSQSLQAGRLSGDEFRSISEILPSLLDDLSTATQRSRKELKQLAAQGLLTPRIMLKALFDNAKRTEELFAETNVTISQGLNILATDATMQFSKIMKSAQVAKGIKNIFIGLNVAITTFLEALGVLMAVLGTVTENLNIILAVLVLRYERLIRINVALALRKITRATKALTLANISLNAILKMNPYLLILSTLILLGPWLMKTAKRFGLIGDEAEDATDDIGELNLVLAFTERLLIGVSESFKGWALSIGDAAQQAGKEITDHVLTAIDQISVALVGAIRYGEGFKNAFTNIMKALERSIYETIAQLAVKALLDTVIKKIKDLFGESEEERSKEMIELQKQAGAYQFILDITEKIRKNMFGAASARPDISGAAPAEQERVKRGVLGTLFGGSGGGGGSVSGTGITAGAATFGIPPSVAAPFANILGPKIDGVGKDIVGGLLPGIKEGPGKIIGKLGSVQSVLSGDLSGLGSIFTGGFSNLSGIMSGLGGILGGGGIGGIFKKGKKLLGFADGGRPPLGVASLVGEEGPELFVPDTPGTIVPNGGMGGTVVIQKLEIMPGANVDQALVDKPMTFWVDLAQEKILPALNTLGQAGNTTTLNFRGNR